MKRHIFHILCPGTRCHKCDKFRKAIENIANEMKLEYTIEFITELDDMLNFEAWILPSIFMDGKPLTRGYAPIKKDIEELLTE